MRNAASPRGDWRKHQWPNALLMLHWQNSVCDPKGVWGKNLCRQIEKNNAIKNAQSVLATARNRGLLTIFVGIGWRVGFPELPENQYYPLLQGAKNENKGIVGTWEVDVIDPLRPMASELIVINFGSDSFEGTDLDRILRANAIGHLFVSGQCIEHVVATTIKRAANMGYNATLIKDATSGFTDSNYRAMLDILPLYAKLITSAEFMLEAPYGGTPRSERAPDARDSFSGRLAFLRCAPNDPPACPAWGRVAKGEELDIPPNVEGERAELKLYRGGHMFYTDPQSRKAFTTDARTMYASP
jgi:nicotinamidase-related amidase